MKKIDLLKVVFFFFTVTNLFAQSASVIWSLTIDQNPNTPTGNIQASPQIIGAGSGAYLLQVVPLINNPYGSYGQRLWMGNQGTAWLVGPPDYTRYIQFDASPTSGNDFTVQNVSFQYSDFPSPNNNEYSVLKAEVWYAIDNNWGSSVQLNLSPYSSPLNYSNISTQTFSKSINVQVQNGHTFSVRIYPYAQSTPYAMIPAFATHRNVIIEGSTSPVVTTGSICGMKFNDLNGNGRKDNGEPGISGVTISLSLGALQMTATTGADGSYCFYNLPAGTYILSEPSSIAGWQQTYPTNPNTHTVVLAAGQNVLNVDFGNKQLLGSICGKKFNDLNGNGQNDNEPGLSGWIIELRHNGSNGVVTLRDTTDSNGNYCFDNLPWDNYTVTEVNKNGWIQTAPASPGSYTITINDETNLIGIDFGNKEVLNPSCTDFENNSLNGWQANNISTTILQNGTNHYIQTTDQAGVSTFYTTSKPYTGNWTSLFANGCGSLCFDVTFIYGGNVYNSQTPPQTLTPYIAIEGNGYAASFIANQQISVGDGWHSYCAPLSFLNSDGTLPSNSDGYWIMTTGTPNDWNSLLTNVTKVRLLADPTSFQNEKIGYDNICLKNTGDCNPPVKLGSICGIKIHDKNGDGIKDSNEDGIPNWTIYLNNGNTTISTTTDANGNYCFNDLPAGNYIVSEGYRTGWKQIFPAAPGTHTINLLNGQNLSNINFSNVEDTAVQLGSICGIKFNDLNGDGKQEDGELGLPNWTFQLSGTANMTVTTDIRGNFCFTNLRAGDYTITEITQNGWEPTTPNSSGTYSVTLHAGQNLTDIKFGNKEKSGSICGMKYNDLNGNGKRDDGEPGLPNWKISLSSYQNNYSGQGGLGMSLTEISVATTDQNGEYCFNNIKQGNYMIGEYHQSGWAQTEPSTIAYGITLSPGQKIERLNFGNKEDITVKLGSICGIKFNDKNGNGVQDSGESGIPDWQINLGGTMDLSVYTDKEGKFCFDNLPPGEYKVTETMKNGWRQTVPSTNFYIVQLASDQNTTDLKFGNKEDDKVQLGSICGTKFNDKNHDGRKTDGEPGIANWTIYLEGPMNLSEVTDDNGNFCFYGLIPGIYTVREENRSGWRQTKPSSITYTLEVGNGDNFSGIDFGNSEDPTVKLGSICGMKFNDLNGNGIKDDGELGIANWTIELSGATSMTATTDARGNYCFTNLVFGRYIVSERNKDGWNQTAPVGGNYTVELTADSNIGDLNFGNTKDNSVKLGSICGMKFNDKNGNGRKDADEDGIYNWQINLGGPTDLTIKTDRYGKYCFDNLKPGVYTIKEEPKADWNQTYPASPDSYTITLTAGQSMSNIDFGNKYEPKVGCVNPPSGMKAWWPLDFSARDQRQDLAGYNNFGIMINGPVQVAGKVLGALQFDGIDDYVEVADHSELNFGSGDFSFDAWIKTSDSNSGPSILLDKRKETSGILGISILHGYEFFLNGGYLSLQIANGAQFDSYLNVSSPVFVADDNWHHIAVTVSRTSKQGIVFYIDGVPTQYGDPTGYQGSVNNDNILRIGAQSFGGIFSGNRNFKGILDEIELFNRVLTPAEIVSIFNAGSSGKCKPDDQLGGVIGHVWHDINHNGVKDTNEVGLEKWPVLLNGPTIAVKETDEDGNFNFDGCKPGSYTLSVAIHNGWSNTRPGNGSYTFEIGPSQSIDGFDFGFTSDPCGSGNKTWYPLGTGVNGVVLALATDGNKLFVGGVFQLAGIVNVSNLAMWNGSSWADVGGGVNGSIQALKVVGNKLYVGGSFTLAGNVSAKNIAMWDGSWHALDNGTNGPVRAIEDLGTDLYVGGMFNTAGTISASCIAKWDMTSSTWSALGGGVTPQASYGVLSLVKNGTDLFVGGRFWGTGGANGAWNIVKLNSSNSSWSPLSTGLGNGTVYALAIHNGELYAGGGFQVAGNGSNVVNYITKWDNTSSSWIPLGMGMSQGWVYALKSDLQYLYSGGFFTQAGYVSANRIAYWDNANWIAMGAGISGNIYPYPYPVVYAIEIMGGDIYVGGAFSIVGNVSANNIAKYSCSGATTTSVGDDETNNVIPQSFKLDQNYPNPFNPSSTIRYHIPKTSFVKITVYDILGREIKVLVNEEKNPGQYEVMFDAKGLASGVYIYTIGTGDFILSKKMLLVK